MAVHLKVDKLSEEDQGEVIYTGSSQWYTSTHNNKGR